MKWILFPRFFRLSPYALEIAQSKFIRQQKLKKVAIRWKNFLKCTVWYYKGKISERVRPDFRATRAEQGRTDPHLYEKSLHANLTWVSIH